MELVEGEDLAQRIARGPIPIDEVLPIAMKMLRREQVPAQTLTNHVLISAKNVFREYPPYDMN